MNIFELIKEDHEKVLMLLKQVQENSNNKSKRNDLINQLEQELLAHNKAEEYLIYKALEKKGHETLAIKSQEEHKLVEQYLETFREDLSEASFLAKAEVLTNLISTHIDEEENETFEIIEDEFSEDEFNDLGQKFQNEKQKK